MREDDRVRVKHMIDAAESIAQFIDGRVRADLDKDLLLQFAVLRAVESPRRRLVERARRIQERGLFG
jgi:uncharacterized protein with HEPN domain